MKLLPVVTASAVASLLAAASIVPAHANDDEPVVTFRIIGSIEVEPGEDTDEPTEPEIEQTEETDEPEETEALEEEQTDDEDESESETPAPDDEVEAEPTAQESEASQEPQAETQDDVTAQVEETPLEESLELFSAVQAEESPDEAAAPNERAVTNTIAPLSQSSAAETNLPPDRTSATQAARSQDQRPTAATPLPTLLEAGGAVGNSPATRAEMDTVPAGRDRAQAANEGQRDIPPEPREVSTIEPTDANRDNNSQESQDSPEPNHEATKNEEPRNTEREGKRVETSESMDNGPLPQTGATAAALAIGGVLLMAVGVVLVARQPRVNESPRRGRRAKRN